MAFSFSNWFKTKPGSESGAPDEAAAQATTATAEAPAPEATSSQPVAPAPQPAAAALEAPPQQRPVASLKSVVPNSVRPVGLKENSPRPTTLMPLPSASSPLRMPTGGGGGGVSPQARTIAFPGGGSPTPQPLVAPSPSVGFGTTSAPVSPTPEPAPKPPAPDVTINLELGDFVDKIPANLLKAGSVDRQRVVPFKAGDLFSDLSRGRASVPASAIYALCPDLFTKPISDSEDVEVPLPLQKLVEQLSTNLQPRADQVAEENVGEIETPFLQVALEDNARFPKPAPKPAPAPVAAAPAPAPVTKVSPAPAPQSTAAPARTTPAAPVIPVPVKPALVSPAPVAPRPAQVKPAAPPAPTPAPVTATPILRPIPPTPVSPAPAPAAPVADLGGLSPAAALRAVQISAVRPTPPAQQQQPQQGPAEIPGAAAATSMPSQAAPPIGVVKRPPSTVRASVAGGKIRLSGPAIPARSINLVPSSAAGGSGPAPIAPGMPPLVVKPAPPTASPAPAGTPSAQSILKRTARIQIPPISVRTGAPASLRPTAPSPSQGSVRTQPMPPMPMPSFRSSPGGGSGVPGAAVPPPAPARPLPAAPPPPSGFKPTVPLPTVGPSAVTARLSVPPPPVLFVPPTPTPTPAPATVPQPAVERGTPEPAAPTSAAEPEFSTPPPADEPPASAPAVEAATSEETIQLALAPILRALPSTFLSSAAAASAIADDVRVALPLAQITPQLAQGRVAVRRAIFEAGLPAAHRGVLAPGDEPAEIPLPLQEIFQNLPTGALSQRQDQVVDEVGPLIPTPFSQKAEEDAAAIRSAAATRALAETAEAESTARAASEAAVAETPAIELAMSVVEAIPSSSSSTSEPEPAAAAETPVVEPVAAPVEAESESIFGSAAPDVESAMMEAQTAAAVEEAAPAQPAASPEPAPTPQVEAVAAPVDTEPEVPSFLIEEPWVAPAEDKAEPAEVQAQAEPAHGSATDAMPPVEAPAEHVAQAETPAPAAPLATESSFAPVSPRETPAHAATPLTAATAQPSATIETAPVQPEPEPATTLVGAAESVASRQERVEAAQEALREVFMVDEDFDAKKVVKLASQLPGMKACTIMFTDGLKLAGNFSADQESEGFCAMTPAFFQKARTFTRELSLGELSDFTIHTERGLLMSFFMHEDVCVSVAHSGRGFLPGVREKLQNVTRQVAALYSTKS